MKIVLRIAYVPCPLLPLPEQRTHEHRPTNVVFFCYIDIGPVERRCLIALISLWFHIFFIFLVLVTAVGWRQINLVPPFSLFLFLLRQEIVLCRHDRRPVGARRVPTSFMK